jgi:LysM repeat protein
MIMKKVFKGTSSFSVLGLKKHTLALAMCAGLSIGIVTTVEASTPTRNVNPPALKASAPNVYVVKKGDTLWDISKIPKKPLPLA